MHIILVPLKTEACFVFVRQKTSLYWNDVSTYTGGTAVAGPGATGRTGKEAVAH